MIIARTVAELQSILIEYKSRKLNIGLIPTMGALHDGHLSLIKEAKQKCSVAICTIFVNPTQFNNADDFEKYPSTFESDIQKLDNIKCDVVFAPSVEEIYPQKNNLQFDTSAHDILLEGVKRPGHFKGVALVVSKLFNIVQPNQVFFGQKDLQQCLLIKNLIIDFSYPIAINICDTIREIDGLAMSSRNLRLNQSERIIAANIYQQLTFAKNNLDLLTIDEIKNQAIENLDKYVLVKVEYFDFLDIDRYEIIDQLSDKHTNIAIVVAIWVGEIRLIDNIIIKR